MMVTYFELTSIFYHNIDSETFGYVAKPFASHIAMRNYVNKGATSSFV